MKHAIKHNSSYTDMAGVFPEFHNVFSRSGAFAFFKKAMHKCLIFSAKALWMPSLHMGINSTTFKLTGI